MVTPFRPLDMVRLRHTPVWLGVVLCIEAEQALVYLRKQDVSWAKAWCWAPLEFLELVPGQFEKLAA